MSAKLLLTAVLILITCTGSFAETMSVAFSGAEVRSAPSSMNSKVIFKAGKYQPLTIKKKGAEYFQVSDIRGRTGYIHKSLLSDTPSVVVTGDRVNVRSGPGTENDAVFQLRKGDGALLLNKQEGWSQIKSASGDTGWVADFLVR